MAEDISVVYGDPIADSLLANGVQTIEMGVDDYYHTLDLIDWDETAMGRITRAGDMRRIGTSIRNIYAGILLVLKSKLAFLSKDTNYSLLMTKNEPHLNDDGSAVLWGAGKNTVGERDLLTRLSKVGVDLKSGGLRVIGDLRKNYEHYFVGQSPCINALKQSLQMSLFNLYEFMIRYLPKDSIRMFDDSTCSFIIDSQKHMADVLRKRDEGYSEYDWEAENDQEIIERAICDTCGSRILFVGEDGGFTCSICEKTYDFKSVLQNGLCHSCCVICDEMLDFSDYETYPLCSACRYRSEKNEDE